MENLLNLFLDKLDYKSLSFAKFIEYDFESSDNYFGHNKNTKYFIPFFKENLNNQKFKKFTFNIDFNDVFIILGLTPPECLYYGYTPYLFAKNDETKVFASINDTINNNVISKFIQEQNISYDTCYNIPFVFLLSKNSTLLRYVYSTIFDILRLNNILLLTIPIPDKFDQNDYFLYILRVTKLYVDSDFSENTKNIMIKMNFDIVKNLNDPYCYYNLNDPIYKNENCSNGFYQKNRNDKINEFDNYTLLKKFNIYTNSLLDMSIKKYNRNVLINNIDINPFGYYKDNKYIVIDTGFSCIDNDLNCLGDNRDSLYRTTEIIDIKNVLEILIICVNHNKTNKSLFCNINVYNSENNQSIYNLDVEDKIDDFYEVSIDVSKIKVKVESIIIAERLYLQGDISPSFQTTIPFRCYTISK